MYDLLTVTTFTAVSLIKQTQPHALIGTVNGNTTNCILYYAWRIVIMITALIPIAPILYKGVLMLLDKAMLKSSLPFYMGGILLPNPQDKAQSYKDHIKRLNGHYFIIVTLTNDHDWDIHIIKVNELDIRKRNIFIKSKKSAYLYYLVNESELSNKQIEFNISIYYSCNYKILDIISKKKIAILMNVQDIKQGIQSIKENQHNPEAQGQEKIFRDFWNIVGSGYYPITPDVDYMIINNEQIFIKPI